MIPQEMGVVRRFLMMLSVICMGVFFILVLFETILRIAGFQPDFVSSERYNFWRHDPHLGWHHKPDTEGIFEAFGIRTRVRINSRALRDSEYAYTKPVGKKRIIALGDSFVWGYGVDIEDTFPKIIERNLSDFEVINAGVSGYSTDQELIWLQQEGVKYDYDLLVLVLVDNDIPMNALDLVYFKYYKPMFSIDDHGSVALSKSTAPQSDLGPAVRQWLFSRFAAPRFLLERFGTIARRSYFSGSSSSRTDDDYTVRLTVGLVDEIGKIVKHKGKQMVVVTRCNNSTRCAEVEEDLRVRGFDVLAMDRAPGWSPETMTIKDHYHWNAVGHQFVADCLIRFLGEKGMITPTP
ncbi:MAG: hypothetical protein LDL33_03995 [Desulfomonile sp.]|nr:hypothetical protein [Desulfomonile sp.]